MSTPREPEELDHEAGARFVEKLLAEDPEKLCVATDEQVDAMMDAARIEVGEPETAAQMLARVERRRRERRAGAGGEAVPGEGAPRAAATRPASRGAWVAGALVAAAAAAVVTVKMTEPRQGAEAIGPEPPSPAWAQAARLREEAVAACHASDFASCTAKLDDAKRLDPAGESEPRVVAARAAIAASSAAPLVPSETPPTEGPKPK